MTNLNELLSMDDKPMISPQDKAEILAVGAELRKADKNGLPIGLVIQPEFALSLMLVLAAGLEALE